MNLFGQAIDPETPPQGDDKTYAIIATVLGIPCTFIGPLIIWAIKKDSSPYVGKVAMHTAAFAGGMLVIQLILMVVSIVVGFIPYIGILSCLISILSLLIGLASLVILILGTIQVAGGKLFLYPITSGFIK